MAQNRELAKFTLKPSKMVLFSRTFFLYQLYRFIVVNLRMLVMIWKSHG
ncbi:MAG: hypothetical protein ACHREM_27870 [Polyangiales bacterium]